MINLIFEYLEVRKTLIIAIISFVIGVFGGAWAWDVVEGVALRHMIEKREMELNFANITKPVKVVETIQGSTETKIVYVPKETVIYRDKATGQTVKTVEKTDLDANIKKTDFTLKVNGREVTFKKADDEKYMFEKNKLQLNQTSRVTASVDMRDTVNALVDAEVRLRERRFSAGVWYLQNGPAVSLGVRRKALEYNIIKGFGKNNDFTGGGIVYRF